MSERTRRDAVKGEAPYLGHVLLLLLPLLHWQILSWWEKDVLKLIEWRTMDLREKERKVGRQHAVGRLAVQNR